MPPERRHIRRQKAVGLAGLSFALLLLLKLVSLQLWAGETYTARAKKQHEKHTVLQPSRGRILDRHGRVLATNLEAQSFFVNNISELDNLRAIAVRFSRRAGESQAAILKKLRGGRPFVWLARKVVDGPSEDQVPEGVGRIVEVRRTYPMGPLAGQVLGYTDIDNRGIEGAELNFEELLNGAPGELVSQVDARGKTLGALAEVRKLPEDGADLFLTLDADYQSIAEEELETALARFRAPNGIVIVAEPATGEILAMADAPLYDPNQAGQHAPQVRRNRAITDSYEPGSTFKMVTFAAALAENIITPRSQIFCENGELEVAGGVIRDVHKSGWLTAREVLGTSSNIGTAKIARQLGAAGLYRRIRLFGFGAHTGIALPGEVTGEVKHPAAWSLRSLETIAIGQEVGVTALQMVAAFGAVANRGRLMVPQIVLEAVRKDTVLAAGRPEAVRQVIPPEVAATLTGLLEGAVSQGTGANAQVSGYRVAGKTGTAQRVSEGSVGYDADRYISSFIGFLPVEKPELLCLVIVDSPQEGHYGSQVAAPVFSRIMQRILSLRETRLRHRAKPRPSGAPAAPGQPPVVVGLPESAARRVLARHGFKTRTAGKGERVADQTLDADGRTAVLKLARRDSSRSADAVSVPNVVGVPLRQAVSRLTAAGLQVKSSGSGWVFRQSPEPGTEVLKGSFCQVDCRTKG